MPRPRRPVQHAITADELSELAVITVAVAADVLDALADRGLHIARRPGRPRHRDAGTGQYVTRDDAASRPAETVAER